MERLARVLLAVVLATAVAVPLAACKPKPKPDTADKTTAEKPEGVTVGSIVGAEGSVLGQMVIKMLESEDIETVDKTALGTSDVCRQAIVAREVDITIDHTGSGRTYYADLASLDVWNDADAAYTAIYKADSEKKDLYWLAPAPADNAAMLCTTKDVSDQFGIASVEDFARYAGGGGVVKLVCSEAFAEDADGLKGLEAAYGFKLTQDQVVLKADGDPAAMLKDLAGGVDGVNFSLAYGADGQIDDLGLVTLADPKSVTPVNEPSAVVRGEVLKAHPEIKDLLEPVFESLTLETLRGLNRRVAFGGEDAAKVAEEYLKAGGFLK